MLRLVGITLSSALVLVAGCSESEEESQAADEMVGLASRFSEGKGWTVVEQRDTGGSALCAGEGHCPSSYRRWRLPAGQANLDELISAAGWDLPIEGDCVPQLRTIGLMGVCSARGQVAGHQLTVQLEVDSSREDAPELVLEVW